MYLELIEYSGLSNRHEFKGCRPFSRTNLERAFLESNSNQLIFPCLEPQYCREPRKNLILLKNLGMSKICRKHNRVRYATTSHIFASRGKGQLYCCKFLERAFRGPRSKFCRPLVNRVKILAERSPGAREFTTARVS